MSQPPEVTPLSLTSMLLSNVHDGNDHRSTNGASSSILDVKTSPSGLSEFEARKYYHGLRGSNTLGPKLVYRTSKTAFPDLTQSETYLRFMRLAGVPVSHKLGENHLWDFVREEVVKILDKHSILFTSVDLVRFSWTEDNWNWGRAQDANEREKGGVKIIEASGQIRYTTFPTIWVGVIPDTTTGEQAHNSATEILELLTQHHISDVEVEFRESKVELSTGPELFAPISDLHPLHRVIDNLSTALSLPISGLKTSMQGTLGFYFNVGDELFAVTARHVLFEGDEPNDEYDYVAGPQREVLVMGHTAFIDYLAFLQRTIHSLFLEVDSFECGMKAAENRAVGEDNRDYRWQERKLRLVQTQVKAIQAYATLVEKEWSEPKNRVIGHIVWSPPLSAATSTQSYTQDFCVIRLDKDKFRHLETNVLNLGADFSLIDFFALMRNPADGPPEPVYTAQGLIEVRDILSEEEIHNPTKETPHWDSVRRVLKRGSRTRTTIGGLNSFLSHVRRYFVTGNLDSIEVAVHNHSKDCWKPPDVKRFFSEAGDSGSVIVDKNGRYVALLTSGAGDADELDISYGTPMYWLWPVILAKFPGAELSLDGEDIGA